MKSKELEIPYGISEDVADRISEQIYNSQVPFTQESLIRAYKLIELKIYECNSNISKYMKLSDKATSEMERTLNQHLSSRELTRLNKFKNVLTMIEHLAHLPTTLVVPEGTELTIYINKLSKQLSNTKQIYKQDSVKKAIASVNKRILDEKQRIKLITTKRDRVRTDEGSRKYYTEQIAIYEARVQKLEDLLSQLNSRLKSEPEPGSNE